MVLPGNVIDGVLARWLAVASLNALIPASRVYTGRAPESVAWPYAALACSLDRSEYTSGAKLLQWFRLNVTAYSNADPPDMGVILAAVHLALAGTASSPAAGLTVTGNSVIHSKAMPGATYVPTGERRNGVDVVKGYAAFEILCEGSR